MRCNRFLFIFLAIPNLSFCILSTRLSVPISTRQVIIHFTQVPNDKHRHNTWNEIIENSLFLINDKLAHAGWIAPDIGKLPVDSGTWERIYHRVKSWYYPLFYRTHSLKYPNKKNVAFFTHIDTSLGLYTMHIPDGVPYQVLVQYLKDIYAKQGIQFHIDPDARVHIAQAPDIGLEGKNLTLKQLEQLKKGTLLVQKEQELAQYQGKTLSAKQQRTYNMLKASLDDYKEMKEALFWYQSFPTTGLRLTKPFWPPAYPYIPHFFSLWQLAPKKGNGVTVAIVDTGVAAYTIQDDPAYIKNQDLIVKAKPGEHNFNIVSADGLDPINQLIQIIKPFINPNTFDQEYLESHLPSWIKNYLSNNDTTAIAIYLQKNGNPELIDTKGTLTQKGQQALQVITTGSNGINPKKPGIKKPFTLAKLTQPYQQDVITEFLPMPEITQEKTTFIAGHGSHTFGLVSAQLKDVQALKDDSGVVGLAPAANTIMIKAFKDNGVSDKSTLIAALKKAVIHDADVVNLSLKIADNLDLTEQSSKLLERIVYLIPYLVAASGNNGDPRLPGYAGKVEAYPARFEVVPFDVGAFAYKGGKAYIAPFSQYEPGIGPLFVAPGFDILSAGLVPGQKTPSEYVFMGGTSMAAPIMTGFVALMLGEFKDKFTREQLLKVCYTSTLKMYNDNEWKTKVILGVLDMRTALFTLHALNRFKDDLKKYTLTFDMEKKFDQALQAISDLLLASTKDYAKKYLNDIDFVTNFMTYFDAVQKNKQQLNKNEFFVPEGNNALEDSIQFVSNSLLQALGVKNIPGQKASKEIIESVAAILKKDTIDLFPGLGQRIKKRLEKKEREQYWANQAEALKLKKDKDITA